MDDERADEFLAAWYEMARTQPGANDLYVALKPAICRLIPGEVESSGVAVVDGIPTVLAVAGTRVLAVHAAAKDDQMPRVFVRSLPLDPDRVTVEVVDNRTGTHPDGGRAHTLRWKFTWADGQVLVFETVVKERAWQGQDCGEAVALSITRRLGWAIPDADS